MELLAPAGNLDALKAAVENGADAVYLGGQLFNARRSADNFSIEEINNVVKYAHLRGVKIYITVNILLGDSEFSRAIEYIHELMKCEVDAIIIQDLGLMYAVKHIFPELPLHASTQMTIHNAYGAKWFKNEGIERLVLAREMSLDEIKYIARNTPVELETFVHGALCFSYSGQCLFSSMIGGRSGNRGKCAQPCRMAYSLIDGNNTSLIKEEIGDHLLSPKDLNVSEILPKLDEAGITSLKIEGRMKRPEYVATVIRVYRAALNRMIDGERFAVTVQEKKDLAQIFNREFTTGYYLFNPGRNLMSYKRPNNRGTFLGRIVNINIPQKIVEIKLEDTLRVGDGIEIWVSKGGREGFAVQNITVEQKKQTEANKGDVVSVPYQGYARIGDRIFKTADIRLQMLAKESYTASSNRRVGISVWIKIAINSPMQIIIKDEDNNEVHVDGTVAVQVAKKVPTTVDMVKQQVDRLGNTAFRIDFWQIDIEPQSMLPVSEINNIRREAINKLEELRLKKAARYHINASFNVKKAFNEIQSTLLKDHKKNKQTKLSVAVSDFEGFKAAISEDVDLIYVGGEQFRRNTVLTKELLQKIIKIASDKNKDIVFSLPRIWHDHEKKYLTERIKIAHDVGFRSYQVATPAGIAFVRDILPDAEIYTDYFFNIFNSFSLKYIISNKIKLAGLSPELTLKQLGEIKGLNNYGECIVFGAMPLMISEHCTLGSTLGNRKEDSKCNFSCREGRYFLQDRLKFKFPVFTDMACRMHIYNAKTLNVLPNLGEILNASPAFIRLDLRVDCPETIKEVSAIFVKALRYHNQGVKFDSEQLQDQLVKLYPQGFTKGHYYRGVIDTEE